ncbi:hypothetical protein Tco_0956491 [Tanacetum coccineum]
MAEGSREWGKLSGGGGEGLSMVFFELQEKHLHPYLPDPGFTMDHLPGDAIGIYFEFLGFFGICLNKVVSFEVVCRDLNIVPTVTLFCVFQCLCKQGDWFSFSKRRNTEDVCMDDGPSSLKKWKDKFFLIDRRAIPDYLTWRHSCSCVSDDLPTDGYDRNDVERLCARLICLREMREEVLVRSGLKMSIYDFMTLPSWGDAKVAEESHHLSSPLLERVPSHTTTPAAEGAMIPLPTPDEIAASLPDPHLAKKSKGPSQVRVRSASNIAPEPSRPSRNRKLKKRASEAGSSALELGQAEGMNEADSTDFCVEIKNSLVRDEGTSMRAALAPTPRLGKRLGAPPSMVVVSASGPSHVGTSAHASTFGRSFSLGGATVSGHARKSEAEVVRRQVDPLDFLARSALAHDVEYDQILEDDFGTATHGEKIDLTLFPLTPGPYQMSYPYEGASSPHILEKSGMTAITLAELKRTESLLLLDLSNRFNVLSVLLVSHGAELNSRYTGLVTTRNRLQEKFDQKAGYVKENMELRSQKDAASNKVKELQTELTNARVSSIGLSEELSQTDAKLSDQAFVEVTWFVGSGVESLVRKLLSSDEFHVALAHVASLGINYGVERGLHIGRTDAEFEVAAQKVSNFHIAAAGSTLYEVTQVLPDMHIRSVTSVLVAPPIANENANQVPLEHASDDLAASI